MLFLMNRFISVGRNGYKFGLGENICIPFEHIPSDFADKRYDDFIFRSCFSVIENFGTVKNAINRYFVGLFNYKNETTSKLNEILIKIEDLQKGEVGVDREISRKVQEVQDASKKLKELFGLVSGKSGVANNLNCSFVRERYEGGKRIGSLGLKYKFWVFYVFKLKNFVE